MKLKQFLIPVCMLALAACAPEKTVEYDPALCAELSFKIDSDSTLTSQDYSDMLGQGMNLLDYYYQAMVPVMSLPEPEQERALRELMATTDFMQRIGHLGRFEAVLSEAAEEGVLQGSDARAYERFDQLLDQYNSRLEHLADDAE